MPYIGNVSGFDDVDTEQIKDGAVSDVKISDVDHSKVTGLATEISTAVSNLVDSSPASLNTLNELAAALGDDASFSTTVTNSIATKATATDVYTKTAADALLGAKAPLASPVFSGNVGVGITPTFTAGGGRRLLQVTNGASGGQIAMGNDAGEGENPRIFSDADSLGFATATTGGGVFQWYTANTERMRIDSSGIVTMPYQPAFSAGTTVNNYNGAVNTVIQWDYEAYDVTNNYNTTTRQFTAPVTGLYHFIIRLQRQSWEGDIAFRKNGSTIHKEELRYTTSDWASECYSYHVRLSANDYVDTYISDVEVAGSLLDGFNNTLYDSFSGHLIG